MVDLDIEGNSFSLMCWVFAILKNSEYDQKIPQSQTADNPVVL